MSSHKFLVHADGDSVGVAISEIQAGETVTGIIMDPDHEIRIRSNHDIHVGHKIALKSVKTGELVIKYGEKIGKATQDIQAGDWVHVHNLKSARW
ncbi:SAF domain protein [Acididesulfobacillus acetoxydans]|uniref:SAF domain n=1 Tax=Acididesulfobacillus acetoxydans TaxID=1561005 RepID=A0A8S0Y4K8_9FIRM|nr:UxaA family hydrolase [Acididesulfobacillus acetoxydans]CAA7603085.1 SAF domain protein [Acididesulfobacillus acetoxydans]CEJ05677.1 SAF domain [Acididesulfobacillus acetoxydans]